MAYVFQHFVFNFLRIECPDISVFRENIRWAAESESPASLSLLPQMQTDITLLKSDTKTIIDTKYYRETLSDFYGTSSFHSENLYQLLSYMANASYRGQRVKGILLYPKVNRDLDETLGVLGMEVRIKTVNLASPWQHIREDLLSLSR